MTLEARYRTPPSPTIGAIVLFHGRGADENDLFPLFDMLDPAGRFRGACPRGPLTLPPGGAHWYVVREVGFPDPATFWPSFEKAQAWLDGFVTDTGIPIERTIIGGFSQGAVMSYALSLAAGRPRPAGLLAFSGFIPTVDGLDFDLDRLDGFRVAIGHGTFDPVISVRFSRAARERLEDAGADVTFKESPMQHSIDPEYLMHLRTWLDWTIDATDLHDPEAS